MSKIFVDQAARAKLADWYQQFLARIDAQVAHRTVRTAHGDSHVLCLGDPSLPKLVCLHGALASSAHVAGELAPLLRRYHVLAPDLPGQSVRGPEVRLSVRDDAYADWLLEVLDGLGLERVDLMGVSWGGFVALQTALKAPERVAKLVLVVPAGIVSGSAWAGITQVAIPMALYRLAPSEARLRRFVASQLTAWDEHWGPYMGDAIRSFVLDLKAPPLATEAAARRFCGPVLLFAASDDVHFPAERLTVRAKALFPQAQIELIPNSRHAPPMTDDFRSWLAERIARFLGQDVRDAVRAAG